MSAVAHQELGSDQCLEMIAHEIETIQATAITRVGRLLHDAQELFRHQRDEGGFQRWVETRLSIKRSTAYRLISVHERFGESVSNWDTLSKSVLYALAAPSTPDDVVAEVVTRTEDGETFTAADVKGMKDEWGAAPRGGPAAMLVKGWSLHHR